MKKHAIIFIGIFLCGCNPRETVFTPGEVVYQPRYASGFTIFAAGQDSRAGHNAKTGEALESRVIRIADPWGGEEAAVQWVFVSRGGELPPEGFEGAVVKEPQNIICMSSSHTAFLTELSAEERIVGVSGGRFITDSLIAARWRAGDVADVGYDANLDLELIASLRPGLMLMYGISDGSGGNSRGGTITDKLGEMDIPYVFVGEHMERTPLGRAEWIVAVGEMLGLRERAEQRFQEIERSYNELRVEAQSKTQQNERPLVMFNAPYRDVWYVPGEDNYMVRLVRDAGGEYVCRGMEGPESRPIDVEEAFVEMGRAHVWLNTNHYTTLAALLGDCPRFASTPPVLSGLVYNNNLRMTEAGGSDFWESGIVRPDVVLGDLVEILHGRATEKAGAASTSVGISSEARALYYYRRLE